MAQGERASRLAEACGKEYFKKKGLFKKAWGWWASVSTKAGQNKKTKRYTNKSIRQQEKEYIKGVKDSYCD